MNPKFRHLLVVTTHKGRKTKRASRGTRSGLGERPPGFCLYYARNRHMFETLRALIDLARKLGRSSALCRSKIDRGKSG